MFTIRQRLWARAVVLATAAQSYWQAVQKLTVTTGKLAEQLGLLYGSRHGIMGSVGKAVSETGHQLHTLKAMPATANLVKQLPSLRREIHDLLVFIKQAQRSELKGEAYVDVTIGCTFSDDGISWNYQTGDNSFTGGAYGHAEWFTTSVMKRSNCLDLAKDVVSEIEGRIYELASFQEAQ